MTENRDTDAMKEALWMHIVLTHWGQDKIFANDFAKDIFKFIFVKENCVTLF